METFSKWFSPSNVYCWLFALVLGWYQRELASSHCFLMTIRWRLYSHDVCMSVELFFSRFFFFFSHFSLDGTMVFYFFSSSFNFCLENGEEKKKFCISIPLVYMIFPSFNYAIHWLYGFCVAISLYTLYTLIERWLFACSSTHFGIYTCITL